MQWGARAPVAVWVVTDAKTIEFRFECWCWYRTEFDYFWICEDSGIRIYKEFNRCVDDLKFPSYQKSDDGDRAPYKLAARTWRRRMRSRSKSYTYSRACCSCKRGTWIYRKLRMNKFRRESINQFAIRMIGNKLSIMIFPFSFKCFMPAQF